VSVIPDAPSDNTVTEIAPMARVVRRTTPFFAIAAQNSEERSAAPLSAPTAIIQSPFIESSVSFVISKVFL